MKTISLKLEIILVVVLLVVSGIAHGGNMFNFPYYENDEGVYISQAWSVVEKGELAPYTYWYDHAPAGWIFTALWGKLTGGFFTFGMSINSGRAFMLVLHLLSTLCVYFIAKKITRRPWAGIIAGLLFSLPPVALYFQRRILLDSIMIFWTLVAAVPLFKERVHLKHVVLSAIAFAIAVLTKENAVFFLPAFLVLVGLRSHKYHIEFALIKWIVIMGAVVSLYPLYALLNSELFPSSETVSLIETLQYQSARGTSVFDPQSTLWIQLSTWLQSPFVVIGGAISTILMFGFYAVKRIPGYLFIGLLGVGQMLFFVRGGVIFDFYIVVLIPLFALAIGLFIDEIVYLLTKKLPKAFPIYMGISGIIAVALSITYVTEVNTFDGYNVYTANQTQGQIEAIEWIRENVSEDSTILIDNYAFLDLRAPSNPSNKTYPNAEWYWKADKDPEVREKKLNNNPANVELVALTQQMQKDAIDGAVPFTGKIIKNSRPTNATFESAGWGVEMWLPRYPDNALTRTWQSYKKEFITAEGRVKPKKSSEAYALSEAQAYAMLRAVWMNDKETFQTVYQYTKQNLRKEGSNLLIWKLDEERQPNGETRDTSTAPDADQDIALALLFASKQWGEDRYLEDAKRMMADLWSETVVNYAGNPYLVAGDDWANTQDSLIINPSYLSPAYYRIFESVSPQYKWEELVDSSYRALNECTTNSLDKNTKGVLPPEWCALDKQANEFRKVKDEYPSSTIYGFNSFRIPWRVGLDVKWYNSQQGKDYLSQLNFLSEAYKEDNKLYASYTHDGKPWDEYESIAAYGGNLAYFDVQDSDMAKQVYENKVLPKLYESADESYWNVPENYYTQNWAWFGTAFYSNDLPNLWEVSSHRNISGDENP